MFTAKAKLANGDTVRLNLPGDNFMAALAGTGQALSQSKDVSPEEAKAIVRLTIVGEEGAVKLQRRKFRPRPAKGATKSTTAAAPSTAGSGPITPLKGEKGGK